MSVCKCSVTVRMFCNCWQLSIGAISALVTFLFLHDLTMIRRELAKTHGKRHAYDYFILSANERPHEYMDKLLRVCDLTTDDANMRENHWKSQRFLSADSILRRTQTCRRYFHEIPSEGHSKVLHEEAAFPLAFIHSIHTDVGVLEMFLSAMFRPQNYHCIHVDPKASPEIIKAVAGIVNCYRSYLNTTNIFLSSTSIPVFWGHITVIEAELICLRDLLAIPGASWKYVLNFAGSEMPNISHKALRKQLQQLKGRDVMVSMELPPRHYERFNETHEMIRIGSGKFDYKINLKGSGTLKDPPPMGIKMFKGYKNVALSRRLANFVTNHPLSSIFYSWLSDTLIPDESYYATLARIKGLDQNTNHVVQDMTPNLFFHEICTRYSTWRNYETCSGSIVRDICNFGFGDLVDVWSSECWVGNKFNSMIDSNAVLCQHKHVMELNKY